MCTTISTLNMSREKWLQLRKSGIGGSDAGAICGLNPYASPMSVYRDKTSEDLSDLDSETMRQGRDLEDYVARRFMEATGLKVRRSNMMYRSEEYPFMIADVDRLIVGEDAGLECKTASAYNADKWKDGEVPPPPLPDAVLPLHGGHRTQRMVYRCGNSGSGFQVCQDRPGRAADLTVGCH